MRLDPASIIDAKKRAVVLEYWRRAFEFYSGIPFTRNFRRGEYFI
jgi:hypothetical protein